MKLLLSIILFFSSLELWAGQISFIGPDRPKPLIITHFEASKDSTVGTVTLKVLNRLKIPFIGSERGMNSIFNTPTGLDAIEVISDWEMLSYGWCYSVNGKTPEVLPSDMKINNSDEIIWWYGYARYFKGNWVSQCNLAHLRKNKPIHGDKVGF